MTRESFWFLKLVQNKEADYIIELDLVRLACVHQNSSAIKKLDYGLATKKLDYGLLKILLIAA